MIELNLSLEVLGNTRFGYSPLGEVTASLHALTNSRSRPILRPWLRELSDRLGSVDMDLLRQVVPPGPLVPDFMFAWTVDPRTTLEDQLDSLLQLPVDELQRDLDAVWGDRAKPAALGEVVTKLGRGRLTDALWEYWDVAIRPHWSRIRAAVDEDVFFRATKLMSGGLYDLLGDLHPEVTLQDGHLRIDKPHHPNASVASPTLALIPSVFLWPQLIVVCAKADFFELHYAARGVGVVWEGLREEDESEGALGTLIGRSRAAILTRLDVPRSTTQLAGELGHSPGTVSEHLTVLRRNGLVTSIRSGRSVLYRRTSLATSIVTLSEASGTVTQLG